MGIYRCLDQFYEGYYNELDSNEEKMEYLQWAIGDLIDQKAKLKAEMEEEGE